MSFKTFMQQIGQDFKKGLAYVQAYLPEAADLAKLIFPAETAAITGVVNATGLIQSAVATVEQKMAAQGAVAGTGTQKAADVLSIVTPTVTQLLTAEGVSVDTAYLQNLVNAVVAILNVQGAGSPAVPLTPVPPVAPAAS